MAKEFAKGFYGSMAWIKCRASYVAHRRGIDGGMCERCHRNVGHIVHHRRSLTPDNINDPDVALGFGNLEYVCMDCHNAIHIGGKEKVPGMVQYSFDNEGNMTVLPPVSS